MRKKPEKKDSRTRRERGELYKFFEKLRETHTIEEFEGLLLATQMHLKQLRMDGYTLTTVQFIPLDAEISYDILPYRNVIKGKPATTTGRQAHPANVQNIPKAKDRIDKWADWADGIRPTGTGKVRKRTGGKAGKKESRAPAARPSKAVSPAKLAHVHVPDGRRNRGNDKGAAAPVRKESKRGRREGSGGERIAHRFEGRPLRPAVGRASW